MSVGLLGTMEMARNAMQTARQGTEVAGHNIANASNETYARQRLKVETASSLQTPVGSQGLGVKTAQFEQVRNYALDKSITIEKGITSYLDNKERLLIQAEAMLGQTIERQTADPSGATQAYGLSEGLSLFFNSMQSVSASPASQPERQQMLFEAQKLSDRFNLIDNRLGTLRVTINDDLKDAKSEANELLNEIAELSLRISSANLGSSAVSNEIYDRRQGKLEELSQIMNFTTTTNDVGGLTLTIDGTNFIEDSNQTETLSTVDGATLGNGYESGMLYIARALTGTAIVLSNGSAKGIADARDIDIKNLRSDINLIAARLITEVNTLHSTGYDLDGVNNTALKFFEGTGSANIKVNTTLLNSPRRFQGAATNEPGDNGIALEMARLQSKAFSDIDGLTIPERYGQIATGFGQTLANVRLNLNDQQSLEDLFLRQRESISGVSIDEEVANLMVYQRAFQASAKLITTIDEMMMEVMAMKN